MTSCACRACMLWLMALMGTVSIVFNFQLLMDRDGQDPCLLCMDFTQVGVQWLLQWLGSPRVSWPAPPTTCDWNEDEISQRAWQQHCRCTGYVKIIEVVTDCRQPNCTRGHRVVTRTALRDEPDCSDHMDWRICADDPMARRNSGCAKLLISSSGMLAGNPILRSPHSHAEIVQLAFPRRRSSPAAESRHDRAIADKTFGVLPIARSEDPAGARAGALSRRAGCRCCCDRRRHGEGGAAPHQTVGLPTHPAHHSARGGHGADVSTSPTAPAQCGA